MPLYRITDSKAQQVKPGAFALEKEIQKLFEANLETLLGVRFIASEFSTGEKHGGRIDTLGLDADGTPTIIEYKRSHKENIINQGLYYLDWLMDHKGDFTLAAQEALGAEVEIHWDNPRLILVAESFSKFDEYAVNRIGANIELWTFRRYSDDLLYLEPLFAPGQAPPSIKKPPVVYTLDHHLKDKPKQIRQLFERLREGILALGEPGEVVEKLLKQYVAYKRGKNFTEVVVQKSQLKLFLDIPHADLDDPIGISEDVSQVGHWGTGSTQVYIRGAEDVAPILALIEQAYRLTV